MLLNRMNKIFLIIFFLCFLFFAKAQEKFQYIKVFERFYYNGGQYEIPMGIDTLGLDKILKKEIEDIKCVENNRYATGVINCLGNIGWELVETFYSIDLLIPISVGPPPSYKRYSGLVYILKKRLR